MVLSERPHPFFQLCNSCVGFLYQFLSLSPRGLAVTIEPSHSPVAPTLHAYPSGRFSLDRQFDSIRLNSWSSSYTNLCWQSLQIHQCFKNLTLAKSLNEWITSKSNEWQFEKDTTSHRDSKTVWSLRTIPSRSSYVLKCSVSTRWSSQWYAMDSLFLMSRDLF